MKKHFGILVLIVSLCLVLCACSLFKKENNNNNDNYNKIEDYNVSYELNGGEATGLLSVVSNGNDYNIPEPSKEGFRFCGWYKNSNFSGSSITEIEAGHKGDVKLYAKFLKLYKATYITDGGSQNNVKNFTSEDDIELLGAKKSGYVFLGWYEDSDFSGSIISVISNQKSDITLYARYGIAYRIYYDLDGGENNADNPLEYAEEQTLPLLAPTKKGMNFIGWFDENDKKVNTIYRGTTGEIELKAKWEVATYRITWDLQGGKLDATMPTQYTYGIGIPANEINKYPTRQGMVCSGWYVDRDGETEYVHSISEDYYDDLRIYAKWVDEVALKRDGMWTSEFSAYTQYRDVARVVDGISVSVPEELMNMYNEGRLGLSVSGTFFANVKSAGTATGNVSAYMLINGTEYYVCGTSKIGGGYKNKYSQVPLEGEWGYSGNITNTQTISINSVETTIGYRYLLTSDVANHLISISTKYGCASLVCKFYIR